MISLSTCLIPNLSVSLPQRRGNTLSLATNLHSLYIQPQSESIKQISTRHRTKKKIKVSYQIACLPSEALKPSANSGQVADMDVSHKEQNKGLE